MDLLQKDVPILTKIYEAKCFYDSQNNRIILYYKNHVTARTLVDFYNLPTTPPPNSSLYVIYDLQTGTFNVSTDPPTYTVSNSKVYVTSPINAEYDMDKVIIYRISWYETDTNIDLNHILTQLNTLDNFVHEQQENTINHILTQLNTLDNFVHEQQENTINHILTQLNTLVRKQQTDTITATHTFDPAQPGPAFLLGPNAQNQLIQYLNADKVDGFDVSRTPAPNTIVPLNADGILDLSATYVKSNVYTFRRVDLTNATSDYMLQVGEEAIINFDTTQSTTKNLRIATSGGFYQMLIWAKYDTSINNSGVLLLPNNQSYNNAFTTLGMWLDEGTYSYFGHTSTTTSCFSLNRIIEGGLLLSYISTYTLGKFMILWLTAVGSIGYGRLAYFVQRWNDTTTPWTSLGTISTAGSVNGTLIILVRRLA
jgi:hypothetical protein